jgi:hypothetical protein
MKLRLFAVATILALGLAGKGQGAVAVTDAQCEAAAVYTEMFAAQFQGRRRVFDSSSFLFLELPPADREWAAADGDRRVPGPPAALVQSMTDRNPLNLCPAMRARLRAMHIPFGRAAVRGAVRHRRNGLFGR